MLDQKKFLRSKIAVVSVLILTGIGANGADEIDALLNSRDRTRELIMSRSRSDSANQIMSRSTDFARLVRNFVERQNILTRLEDMQVYTSGVAASQPWSDTYWPIYLGLLGQRYEDQDFPLSYTWLENFNYILKSPAFSFITSGEPEKIETLSPSEKYDLLIGDKNQAYTKFMWKQGQYYYDSQGTVEGWMGICHGWSAASFKEKRPSNLVEVLAADGVTKLKFYPSDIKALASQMWADGKSDVHFIGGRCNVKNPKVDENGRIIDPDCFDTDPALWHMVVVNQLGVSKANFVIDTAYDFQVWNQPMVGYSYTYFNPKTGVEVNSLSDASVKVVDFPFDKFKKYRSPNTFSIVGIKMVVSYGVETSPDHKKINSEEDDFIRTATFTYDLEVTEEGLLVGGEWHQTVHPDFIWTPTKSTRPLTIGDLTLPPGSQWNRTEKLPALWIERAKDAAPKGLPLTRIVDSLIKFAN